MEQRLYDAAIAGEGSLLQLIEEVPLLLDKASLICQDKNPLHIAAMFGHVNFVKKILENNSNMCFAPDRFGRNPLHLAAIGGKLDVLKVLLDAEPMAAREKTAGGDTVLHLCIKYNQLKALEKLVEAIKDQDFANMKNGDGMTVLHLAVCNMKTRREETIKYLVDEAQVDVNALNANGNTALDLSPGETNSEIAQSLEAKGAKIGKKIRGGEWWAKKREALMVVASLIATMAFAAGVSPPGGVWQDDLCYNGTALSNDSKCLNETNPHMAGTAVMAEKYPKPYRNFVRANTVAFVSSLSVILLLVSGLPFKRNNFLMWGFMAAMWMTVTAAAITYVISFHLITPKSNMGKLRNVTPTIVWAWCGVMGLLLLGTIRLLNRWLKIKGIDLLKNIKPDIPAVQEQSNHKRENIEMPSV